MTIKQPKTATQLMIEENEERILAHRDTTLARNIAQAAIAEMVGDVFEVEEPKELVGRFTRAVEHAAYMAIQADRKQFQEDLKIFSQARKFHYQDLMRRPPAMHLMELLDEGKI